MEFASTASFLQDCFSKANRTCKCCSFDIGNHSTSYTTVRCKALCVYHATCFLAAIDAGMRKCVICHTPLSPAELGVDPTSFVPTRCAVDQWRSAVATAARLEGNAVQVRWSGSQEARHLVFHAPFASLVPWFLSQVLSVSSGFRVNNAEQQQRRFPFL